MSVPISGITVTPGVRQSIVLPNPSGIAAIKFTNGTPYDITHTGFGAKGTSIIPEGTEYMLYADQGNTGSITFTPVDNLAYGGTGIVNLVVYDVDEPLPKGNWPITVPAQVVKNVVPTTATAIVNSGNAAGTHVIDCTVLGDLNESFIATNDGKVQIGDAAHPGQLTVVGAGGAFMSSTNTLFAVTTPVQVSTLVQNVSNSIQYDVPTQKSHIFTCNGITLATISDVAGTSGLIMPDTAGHVNIISVSDGLFVGSNGIGTQLDNGTWKTDNLGNFTFTGKIGVTVVGDVIDATAAATLYIKTRSLNTDHIYFQVPNGTTIAQLTGQNNAGTIATSASTFNVAGDLKVGGSTSSLTNNLYFPDGSKVASYHGINGTSGAATNHNCPKQPTYYTAVPDLTAGVTTINVSAINATQITVATGNGGNWRGFATTFN